MKEAGQLSMEVWSETVYPTRPRAPRQIDMSLGEITANTLIHFAIHIATPATAMELNW